MEGRFDFSGPVWLIDPIDGTANYAHGHPYVSISVALRGEEFIVATTEIFEALCDLLKA